jgi:hypothetical protein
VSKTTNVTQTTSSTGSSNTTNDGTNSETITDDQFERGIQADTPENRLQLTTNDGQGTLEYASNIEETTANNSRTGSGTDHSTSDMSTTLDGNNSQDTTETDTFSSSGKIGVQSYSKMVQEYRETFLRIEQQIFKECEQLFMGVY